MANKFFTGVGNALAGIGTSFASGILGSVIGNYSANQQYKYQRKLNEQQFDLQKQMFDYTSEYNTPANQVGRLQEAGLNPNLAYGNGASSASGTTGSISGGQAQQGVRGQVDSLQFAQLQNLIANTNRSETQSGLDKSQSEYLRSQTIGQLLKNYSENYRNKFIKEFVENELRLMSTQSDYYEKSAIERDSQALLNRETATTEVARRYNLNVQSQQYLSQVLVNISQAAVNGATVEKIAQDIKESAARIRDINSNISYRDALIAVAEAQEEYIIEQTKTQEHVTSIKGFEKANWHTMTDDQLATAAAERYKNYITPNSIGVKVGPVSWDQSGTQISKTADYKPRRTSK